MVEKVSDMVNIEENFNYTLNDKFILEDNLDRKIFLNSDIDESTIDTAVYQIMRYNAMDIGVPVEERKPIRVYLNSCGGNIVEGYALVDVIELSKTPVYTINLGASMSMALLIFMAGHKRYAMPRSEFLLHEGTSGGFDSLMKLQDRLRFESEQVETITRELVLSRSKITEDQYAMNLRREWYFLPKEGKEIGIIDYIVGEDCELEDIL